MRWYSFTSAAQQKHSVAIAMTGVTLGDRLLQVGCTDASLLGAIGSKVGLSGRVCAVVPDDAHAARARRAAEKSGFLLEARNRTPGTFSVRGRRVQSDRRRQSGRAAVEHAARAARRHAAAGVSHARCRADASSSSSAASAAASARCWVRRRLRPSIRTTNRRAAPSSRSRPKASAPPGCWPSETACPSSKAYVSGDTPGITLNFPSNSRRKYGKGFAL